MRFAKRSRPEPFPHNLTRGNTALERGRQSRYVNEEWPGIEAAHDHRESLG